MTILVLIGMIFMIIWEIFHEKISLCWVLLLLLMNFVSGFRLKLMYASPIQNITSSLTHIHLLTHAPCRAAIVHRNHFFCLYQKDKSSDFKVKFRQVSNHCKRVLEAAKLAYADKTKESITFQKLGSRDFWQIANSVLNKSKYAIPPLINSPEVLSSAKQNCFLKTFLRTLILMTQVSLYLTCFPS